jgi:hypothetical protein
VLQKRNLKQRKFCSSCVVVLFGRDERRNGRRSKRARRPITDTKKEEGKPPDELV